MTSRRLPILALCALLGACATKAPGDHVALPPAPPPGEPVSVIGMTGQSLRIAFGAPAFVRKDGGGEMWRYDGPPCRAFFFLYPESAGLTVHHVETMPRPATAAADTTCLDVMRHRAPTPTS
jgi:hypothetical protein